MIKVKIILSALLAVSVFALPATENFDLNEICEGYLFKAIAHPTGVWKKKFFVCHWSKIKNQFRFIIYLDQSLFIGCVQGRGTIFGCENEGEIFDPEAVACVDRILLTTTDDTIITTTEEPWTTTTEEPANTPSQPPTTTSWYETTTRIVGDVFVRFVCPVSGFGFIPHETDCSRYFECIRGVRNPRTCPTDLHYDIITQECRPSNEGLCADVLRCV